MGRRSSAFDGDLEELDALDKLPGLPAGPTGDQSVPTPPSAAASSPPPARPTRKPRPVQPASASRAGGTRATQVRLAPALAEWLSVEAHRTGRTLASVVALAAKAHRGSLPLIVDTSDGLDVSRRTATVSVPITLRLTGAQRELLDGLAADHATTRSAIVVAALTAARAA
jgi:hypothetical protein